MKFFILFFSIFLLSSDLFSQTVLVLDDGSLDLEGRVIHKAYYASGTNDVSGLDEGIVPNRTLTYNKRYSNTKLRISYTDNLRVLGPNNACTWEMRIDSLSCPSQDLIYSIFVSEGNSHQNKTMVGYCDTAQKGDLEIQIWVGPTSGYTGSDCYTGWNNTWLIEVEEVY